MCRAKGSKKDCGLETKATLVSGEWGHQLAWDYFGRDLVEYRADCAAVRSLLSNSRHFADSSSRSRHCLTGIGWETDALD